MRRFVMTAVAVAALAGGAGSVSADVWDFQTDPDNTFSGDNELVHGSEQIHDLGTRPGPIADQDWYRMVQSPRASYEAVLDSPSGDIGFSPSLLARVDTSATVLQAAEYADPGGVGYAWALRWINGSSSAVTTERILVQTTTTTLGTDDVYTIRYYETTYGIPRFNNAGGQVTVLQIQNTMARSVNVQVHFWATNGAFLGTHSTAIAARGLLVLNTNSLGFATGIGGSLTVANDAAYGTLVGKAVAVEPATGFTFDSTMMPRAN